MWAVKRRLINPFLVFVAAMPWTPSVLAQGIPQVPAERRWCMDSYEAFAAGPVAIGYSLHACTNQGWAILAKEMECVAYHPTYGFAVWMGRDVGAGIALSLRHLVPQYTAIEEGQRVRFSLAVNSQQLFDEDVIVHRELGELPRYRVYIDDIPALANALDGGTEFWVAAVPTSVSADIWRFDLEGAHTAIAQLRSCAGRDA